jgi:nucleolin
MAKTISEIKEKIVEESSDDSSVVSESSSEDEISNQATVKDEKEGNSTDDDSSSVASSSDEEEEKEDSDKEEASEEDEKKQVKEETSDKESVSEEEEDSDMEEEEKEDSDMEEASVKEEEKQVPVKKEEEKKEKIPKKDAAVKADNKSTTPTQTKKRPAPDSTQETPKKAVKLNDGTSQEPPSATENTVYVGQLLLTATAEDVHTFFAECGEITDIRLMTFPDGQGKGYGYIDFAENEGKIKAKALNGSEWNGRTLKVGDAQPKNASEKFVEKTTTIFIGNLDNKLKEKDIREAFKKFGDIKAVHIVQRKKHATAFLRYASKKHAANAIREMNTTELHGRKVVLRFSKNNSDNLYKKKKK